MTSQIDTTAENNGVRLVQQTSHPSSPSSGHELLYVISGSPHGGLFLKDSSGRQIGPFITGTANTGGSLTLQFPPLKIATPTDDFDAASLNGAWSAHSSGGSFSTSDVITQSPFDVPGSSIALMYSAQMGGLYRTHSNGDLDFDVGMLRMASMATAARMMGIAALDSSGNGVGVVVYTDNNVYIATITAWNYVSQSDTWSPYGMGATTTLSPSMPYWLRLKRISGTWTGYASLSGKTWDKTFATRSDSVTVDRIYFGLLYNTASTYHGIITADYFNITT